MTKPITKDGGRVVDFGVQVYTTKRRWIDYFVVRLLLVCSLVISAALIAGLVVGYIHRFF